MKLKIENEGTAFTNPVFGKLLYGYKASLSYKRKKVKYLLFLINIKAILQNTQNRSNSHYEQEKNGLEYTLRVKNNGVDS